MKERSSQYTWIPLWVDKWLFGSTRIELQPDERSVWIDLMALASKDDGYIRANETTPYLDEQLAGLLFIPIELLRRTIEKCLDGQINKIKRTEQGTLYIKNWETYRLSERHKRRFHVLKNGHNDQKQGRYIREEKRILRENNIKEDKKIVKKQKYGEYQNVLLTDEELQKLKDSLGEEKTQEWIKTLDEGIRMKGYKYLDHYLVILKWIKKEDKGRKYL